MRLDTGGNEADAKDARSNSDDLRPEYDLVSLPVRRLGPGRTSFGNVVRVEPDVVGVLNAIPETIIGRNLDA